MREDLQEDFIRTARAKGVRRAARDQPPRAAVAAPAIAAMTGVNVSTLLINIAVIEYAYSIPGLFRLINTAVRAPADVPVLRGAGHRGSGAGRRWRTPWQTQFKPGSTRESRLRA